MTPNEPTTETGEGDEPEVEETETETAEPPRPADEPGDDHTTADDA
jgi:hypothetical protein